MKMLMESRKNNQLYPWSLDLVIRVSLELDRKHTVYTAARGHCYSAC